MKRSKIAGDIKCYGKCIELRNYQNYVHCIHIVLIAYFATNNNEPELNQYLLSTLLLCGPIPILRHITKKM